MDPAMQTEAQMAPESSIRLEHERDLMTNSEATKKLLDEYAAADKELKEAAAKKNEIMQSETGLDITEQSKKVKETKTKRDKLKNDVLELVMNGEIKRAGFTKYDKKGERHLMKSEFPLRRSSRKQALDK